MHDDIKTLLEQQGTAFDQFKADYDAALAAERKEREDLEIRLSRPGFTSKTSDAKAVEAERKAVGHFIRNDDVTELKALSVGSDPDGGYLVVTQMADAIRTKVRDVSPIGGLARHIQLDKADSYAEPYDLTDMGAEWTGEVSARTGLQTPSFAMLNVPLHELTTSQVVTQKLLDTNDYNVGSWIEGRIADKFARTEGAAFVAGDGVLKPRGILSYDTSTDGDSTRSDGLLQYVPTGVDGDFAATVKGDKLIDLVYTLRSPYRARAAFLMNTATAGKVRKFKDGQGNYMWSDSLTAGMPATLLGYPVYLDEEMPDIATDSYSIAFGDFFQGYLVIEQQGVKMIRDPYSNKPHVIFYAIRRVGGAVAEGEAIKLLKFSTS